MPKEGDERLTQQIQVVLKPEHLDPKLSLLAGSFANEPAEGESTVLEPLDKAYQTDSFPSKILDLLRKGIRQSKEISLGECEEDDNGHLLYRSKIYVPNSDELKLSLLREYHDKPSAGHPG